MLTEFLKFVSEVSCLILFSILANLNFFNFSFKWIKVLCLLAIFYMGERQKKKQTKNQTKLSSPLHFFRKLFPRYLR